MSAMRAIIVGAFVCATATTSCRACDQWVSSAPENSWGSGSVGPEICKDGTWQWAVRVSQPVSAQDASGVDAAQEIAEEKGKAVIVSYLRQHVSSKKTITETDVENNNAVARGANNDAYAISGKVDRQITTSVSQLIESFASGELLGVVVLGKGYDPNTKIAWAEVGISQKSMSAARLLQREINK